MTFTQYLITFLALYIGIYSLLDRLCKCIENCAMAKAFAKFYDMDKAGDEHELSKDYADQHC